MNREAQESEEREVAEMAVLGCKRNPQSVITASLKMADVTLIHMQKFFTV